MNPTDLEQEDPPEAREMDGTFRRASVSGLLRFGEGKGVRGWKQNQSVNPSRNLPSEIAWREV